MFLEHKIAVPGSNERWDEVIESKQGQTRTWNFLDFNEGAKLYYEDNWETLKNFSKKVPLSSREVGIEMQSRDFGVF